ncbi:MAG TPA: class I SAM-dependent methyltransferase [Kofleriaceae bacterium]|nr:class I SAM-dependent methyltransferase [Kofleriaceae bacterium]
MSRPQSFYPVDLDELVGWVVALAAGCGPGARILEIGCGDGEVVRRLRARGLDAIGVDPHAEPAPGVIAQPFEELEALPFDVIFASVSLHHAHDPARAVAALRRLSRPGTVMAVREFDRMLLDDEPTLRWWFHQRHALAAIGIREEDAHDLGSFEEFVAGWRAKMAEHVHPWATVAAMLSEAGFVTESVDAVPYLFRWGLSELVRPLEEALIEAGKIVAVGVRWVGRRRADA